MSKKLTPAQLRKLPPRKRAKYKTLSKINSPIPSQLKELRNIIQEATVVRREPPEGPKIKPITDKYPPGKFAGPSTKRPKENEKPTASVRKNIEKLRSRIRQDQLSKKPIKPIAVSDELGGSTKVKKKDDRKSPGHPSIRAKASVAKPKVKKKDDRKSPGHPSIRAKASVAKPFKAPTDKDQEEINKNVTEDPKVTAKLKAKPQPIIPFGSGEAGTGNIPSILNKFVKTSGGWDKFAPGKIEKGFAKIGGGKARDAITSAEDALYTKLLKKRNSDDPTETLTSSEQNWFDNFRKPESRKKGGKVRKKKKKQGYKARKDESIAMRVKKKRTKKQLKASRDESYGKWGKGKGKGKINKSRIKSTIRRTSGTGQGAKFIADLYD